MVQGLQAQVHGPTVLDLGPSENGCEEGQDVVGVLSRTFALGSAGHAAVGPEESVDVLCTADMQWVHSGVFPDAVVDGTLCSTNHRPGLRACAPGDAALAPVALARQADGAVHRASHPVDVRHVPHPVVGVYVVGTLGVWHYW